MKHFRLTVFGLLATMALASGPVWADSPSVTALQQQVQALQAQVAALRTQLSTVQAQLSTVQANPALKLGAYVSVNPFSQNGLKGPIVIFQGANIQIVSGSGSTVDSTGRGNLVIGYNEDTVDPGDVDTSRGGSHNLVVGSQHEYVASGGIIGGYGNSIGANFSSLTGGECNSAGYTAAPAFLTQCSSTTGASDGSSVSGGILNHASGLVSSISGGRSNQASGDESSVSGGSFNQASGDESSVSGGFQNLANGDESSVSGGSNNQASGLASSASGGSGNNPIGFFSSVGGGLNQVATGNYQNIN